LLIQFNHITFILTDFYSLYSIRIFHVSRKHFIILPHCRSIDISSYVICPIAFVKAHRVNYGSVALEGRRPSQRNI